MADKIPWKFTVSFNCDSKVQSEVSVDAAQNILAIESFDVDHLFPSINPLKIALAPDKYRRADIVRCPQ